jgi:hypothetical protein
MITSRVALNLRVQGRSAFYVHSAVSWNRPLGVQKTHVNIFKARAVEDSLLPLERNHPDIAGLPSL